MARTLRRKVRKSGDGGKVVTTGGPEVAANVPQIQELQDLMDSHASKVEAIRANYSQQNSQLAKANSSLMMKLSELEKKVSDLVKENVSLRSTVSMGEFNYKKRLSEQLEILESGISYRVEEIFHMFDRVRARENLSPDPSSSRTSELRSILRNRRTSGVSLDGRKSANSIQFIETDREVDHTDSAGSNQTTESRDRQDEGSSRRKRRKSSRRESIFLPTDFDFRCEEPRLGTEQDEIRHDQSEFETNAEMVAEPKELQSEQQNSPEDPFAQEDSPAEPSEKGGPEPSENLGPDQSEGSFNFTNSIIEYSIPEEVATSTSSGGDQPSSSKIKVFRDEPESVPLLQKDNDSGSNHQINDANFVPLSGQNKAKHSMRAPGARARSKIVDEVMPTTNSGTNDIDFTRTRRTRGKAIDYTLPSLRAKMRRPSEKFVDATTFTSIQELQVTNSRRNGKKQRTRTSGSETALKEAVVNDSLNGETECKSYEKKDTPNVTEPSTSSQTKHIIASKSNNTANRNKVTFQDKPILKDITNKPKASKTRKLLKNAIINDICDNNTDNHDDASEFSSSGGSSLRLHEEDLSVFDLIGSESVKPSNKTYRGKLKKMVNK